MAHLNFRLRSISLDDEEDVREITAVTRRGNLGVIESLAGDLWEIGPEDDDGWIHLTLPVSTMLSLFRAAGQIRGTDARHPVTTDIYDSLSAVVYGLIED